MTEAISVDQELSSTVRVDMGEISPKSLEEAWELFDSRRFLHGHRETMRESFDVIFRDAFPASPSPSVSEMEVADLVTRLSKESAVEAAMDLLRKNGWKPGDQLSAHSVSQLMGEFALMVDRGEIQCGWPDCGCCADAACRDAVTAMEAASLRSYAHEATKVITGLAGGGSENFCGQIGDMFKADLEFCAKKIRDRHEMTHGLVMRAKKENDALKSEMEALRRENGELTNKLKEANHRATNYSYMMDAYRAMLGPVASELVKKWDEKGVIRQHTSWGPDAHKMTGEERAQALLDAFLATSQPLDFGGETSAALSQKGDGK